MLATDSVKTLAHRYDLTRPAIRAIAADLSLDVTYSPNRRTYVINESATTVRQFNDHLTELTAH